MNLDITLTSAKKKILTMRNPKKPLQRPKKPPSVWEIPVTSPLHLSAALLAEKNGNVRTVFEMVGCNSAGWWTLNSNSCRECPGAQPQGWRITLGVLGKVLTCSRCRVSVFSLTETQRIRNNGPFLGILRVLVKNSTISHIPKLPKFSSPIWTGKRFQLFLRS